MSLSLKQTNIYGIFVSLVTTVSTFGGYLASKARKVFDMCSCMITPLIHPE